MSLHLESITLHSRPDDIAGSLVLADDQTRRHARVEITPQEQPPHYLLTVDETVSDPAEGAVFLIAADRLMRALLLTADDAENRERAVSAVLRSHRFETFEEDPEVEAELWRFARGEIDLDELQRRADTLDGATTQNTDLDQNGDTVVKPQLTIFTLSMDGTHLLGNLAFHDPDVPDGDARFFMVETSNGLDGFTGFPAGNQTHLPNSEPYLEEGRRILRNLHSNLFLEAAESGEPDRDALLLEHEADVQAFLDGGIDLRTLTRRIDARHRSDLTSLIPSEPTAGDSEQLRRAARGALAAGRPGARSEKVWLGMLLLSTALRGFDANESEHQRRSAKLPPDGQQP